MLDVLSITTVLYAAQSCCDVASGRYDAYAVFGLKSTIATKKSQIRLLSFRFGINKK